MEPIDIEMKKMHKTSMSNLMTKYDNIGNSNSQRKWYDFFLECNRYYQQISITKYIDSDDISKIQEKIDELIQFLDFVTIALHNSLNYMDTGANQNIIYWKSIPQIVKEDISILASRIETLKQTKSIMDHVKDIGSGVIERNIATATLIISGSIFGVAAYASVSFLQWIFQFYEKSYPLINSRILTRITS